jgi:thiamine-monophosphate kinase
LIAQPDHDTATVESIGERALIQRVRRRAGTPPPWITIGIGDDAAVVRPPGRGALDVLTTDAMVEGVHFQRHWTRPRALGHKALAVNLSDLAAMGAKPYALLLSLMLPAALPLRDFDEIIDGFLGLAESHRAPLAGGNITRSPGPLIIDVTALGTVHARRVLTRSGGRPGDDLFATGAVGAAAAGLAMLQRGADRASLTPEETQCLAHYEEPTPRLAIGVQVAGSRAASACVDLSDGLADGVRQLATASRSGGVVDATDVPIHPGAAAWAGRQGGPLLDFALSGGEDYELLFAVPPKRRAAFVAACRRHSGVPVTRIGRLTPEPGCWLERDGRREPLGAGFAHF